MQLVVQFVHLRLRLFQSFSSRGSNHIQPSRSSSAVTGKGLKQARALQPMQQRIQCAGPDAVAVVRKLLHHCQPEDRLMTRVQKHVNPNQAVEQLALVPLHRN